tara:strand:- start:98 stop:355 length:258 start_codon:yes stop_codon:yes gene_type:complete
MQTIKALKISWNYGGEHGAWMSREKRFQISPEFVGGVSVTPAWYCLTDNLQDRKGVFFRTQYFSVGEAKKAAEEKLNWQWKPSHE